MERNNENNGFDGKADDEMVLVDGKAERLD